MSNYQKDFDNWNEQKKVLQKDRASAPFFHDREVWWCSLGVNIGWEEDGKNENFERPVLVLQKFNNDIFLGLPTTTTIRKGKFFHTYKFAGEEYSVILSQVRLLDKGRLLRKVGYLTKEHYQEVKLKFMKLIL